MRRDQLEHLIRASAAILGEREIIVIGSQAILGSYPEFRLPAEATASIEADLVPLNDPDETKSTLVDGSIGELSPFHETFGIYAHGVGESTARLPTGWRERLVPLRNENTGGAVGWCLDPHDLVVAKLLARRDHDRSFCAALLRAGLVDEAIVLQRLDGTEATDEERRSIRRQVAAWSRAAH